MASKIPFAYSNDIVTIIIEALKNNPPTSEFGKRSQEVFEKGHEYNFTVKNIEDSLRLYKKFDKFNDGVEKILRSHEFEGVFDRRDLFNADSGKSMFWEYGDEINFVVSQELDVEQFIKRIGIKDDIINEELRNFCYKFIEKLEKNLFKECSIFQKYIKESKLTKVIKEISGVLYKKYGLTASISKAYRYCEIDEKSYRYRIGTYLSFKIQ